jgi:hypothetical protein
LFSWLFLLFSFEDLVDSCKERVIHERQRRKAPKDIQNPLGALTFDPSGNSISWKPPEGYGEG